jgi:copper transport protein
MRRGLGPSGMAHGCIRDDEPRVPPDMNRRVSLSIAALAAVAYFAFASATSALPVSAHAELLDQAPPAGANLAGNPAFVELTYGSPVVGVQVLRVSDDAGAPMALGKVEHLQAGRLIRARLPRLAIGHYRVYWRVISADSHETAGTFAFTVGIGTPTTSSQSGSISLPQAGARWVFLMGALLAFGGMVSARFIWPSRALSAIAPPPPVVPLLTIGLAGALAQLVLVAGADASGALGVKATVTQLVGDKATLFAASEAVLILASLVSARLRRRGFAAIGSALAIALAAASGHPGEVQNWWAAPTNVVHVLAVAVWFGGLAHLVLVGARGQVPKAEMLRATWRYASIALWSMLLVISTGVVEGVAQIPSARQLQGSGYGQLLLAKSALVGIALVLALAARFGGLRIRKPARDNWLRATTRGEAGFLVAVIAAAALLAHAAPPTVVQAAAVLPPPPLHGHVVELAEFDGHNLVRIRADGQDIVAMVTGPDGKGSDVPIDIRTILPTGDYIDVTPRRCGPGCATGPYPLEMGTTAVLVIAGRLGDAGAAGFNLVWPSTSPGLDRISALQAQLAISPRVAYTETTTTSVRTTAPIDRAEPGHAFALRSGIASAMVRLLPEQQGADQLLLFAPDSNTYFELTLSSPGKLVHELEVSPTGRVERTFH